MITQKHSMEQHHFDHNKKGTPQGYIALISILIVGAVGVSIGFSVVLLGLGFSKSSFTLDQSGGAKALVNACAEDALQEIRDFTLYAGTDSLSLGEGSCSFTVIKTGGQNREIEVSGTVGAVTRRAKVVIDAINPQISITSWQELADF